MNRPYTILAGGVVLAIALIVCGWLIRDGLLAVSAEMRNRPENRLPEEVRLTLGNSEAVVSLGKVSVEPSAKGNGGTLNLEKVRIDLATTRPTQ